MERAGAHVARGAGHTLVDTAVALEERHWRRNNGSGLAGKAEGMVEGAAAAGMRLAGHLAVDGAVLAKTGHM